MRMELLFVADMEMKLTIADYIVNWALGERDRTVLEPSFGDGIFIDAAIKHFNDNGNTNPEIIGIELQEKPFQMFMKKHPSVLGYKMDFMDFEINKPINAIVGNPPYVGLKKLKKDDRQKALNRMATYGVSMPSSASMWMPFLIHSSELLSTNGKFLHISRH